MDNHQNASEENQQTQGFNQKMNELGNEKIQQIKTKRLFVWLGGGEIAILHMVLTQESLSQSTP